MARVPDSVFVEQDLLSMVNRTELESVHVYREDQRVSGRAVVPLFYS